MAVAEVIIICIDNSRWMPRGSKNLQTQLDAIKFYCQAKFEAHPETVVGLFTMGSAHSRQLLFPPTRSLPEIISHLYVSRIMPSSGELNIVRAVAFARPLLRRWLHCPDKQTRMLFFVGGLTNLYTSFATKFGEGFRDKGIAVDVVNFYLGENPKHTFTEYQFGWRELDAFVAGANSNGNSHIVHVDPGSSIGEVLSKSILKKDLSLQEEKSKEYSERECYVSWGCLARRRINLAAADDDSDEAPGIEYGKHVTRWNHYIISREVAQGENCYL